MRFVSFIIIAALILSNCSCNRPDSISMKGLPKSDFTIEHACFLNQDTSIMIGRHKEYMNPESTKDIYFFEIYMSNNQGANWNLKTRIPFDTLMHLGEVIKSDSGLFSSVFLQNGDTYILHIKLYPTYSTKLVSTGKNRITPITFHGNLLFSITESNRGYDLITMDSIYRILNRVPVTSVSQGVLWKGKLAAIKRYINDQNLFIMDDKRLESYSCPLNTLFIKEIKNGICVAGNNESNDVEVYIYSDSFIEPHLLYSAKKYTFIREMITDNDKSIILILGKKAGAFMRYQLLVSKNSGIDWQQLDIPNSELYGACALYKENVYIYLINSKLIRYEL